MATVDDDRVEKDETFTLTVGAATATGTITERGFAVGERG